MYTQAIYQEYPVQLDNIIQLGLCTSDGFTIIYSSISLKQQSANKKVTITQTLFTPTHRVGAIAITLSVRPLVHLSVRSHFR